MFSEVIFCAYGEYEIPNLIANKQNLKGIAEERVVLEAISMARLKQNPMSEILSLWSDKVEDNGVLDMNFHPLQKMV